VGAPLGYYLFFDDIRLVERHEYLGDEREEVGVGKTNEALDAAEERFLVFLGCHHL
jgi:hypothetical protein